MWAKVRGAGTTQHTQDRLVSGQGDLETSVSEPTEPHLHQEKTRARELVLQLERWRQRTGAGDWERPWSHISKDVRIHGVTTES